MAYGRRSRRRRRYSRKYKRRTGYRPEVNYKDFSPSGDSYDAVSGANTAFFKDVPAIINMTGDTNNATQANVNAINQNTAVDGRTGRRVYSKNLNCEFQLHVQGIGAAVDLCPFDLFIDVWCFKKQSQQAFPTASLFDLTTYTMRKMDHTSEILHLKRIKVHVPLDTIVSNRTTNATDACYEKTINFNVKTGKVITYRSGAVSGIVASDIIENGIFFTAMKATAAVNITTQLRPQGKVRHFFYEF